MAVTSASCIVSSSHLNDDDGGGPLCGVWCGDSARFCCCLLLPDAEAMHLHLSASKKKTYAFVALALGLCIFWLPSASVHLIIHLFPCSLVQLYTVLLLR